MVQVSITNEQPLFCRTRLVNPKHIFSVTVEDGPVFDIKACPSGGFTEDRLGLVAIASSSPRIDIVALPQPTDRELEFADMIQAIKLRPSAVLIQNESINASAAFPLKIAWSQAKGHSLVAAGFTDGKISVWRLGTTSKLLIRNGNEIIPIMTFVAHQEAITGLCFHHTDKEVLLASGSQDRRLKVFLLNDSCNNVTEIMNSFQKSHITSLAWSQVMFFYIYALDTDFCIKQAELRVKNVPGIALDNQPIFSIEASVTDVTFNEWTNVSQFATSAGEVFSFFCDNYMGDSKAHKRCLRPAVSHVEELVDEAQDAELVSGTERLIFYENPVVSGALLKF